MEGVGEGGGGDGESQIKHSSNDFFVSKMYQNWGQTSSKISWHSGWSGHSILLIWDYSGIPCSDHDASRGVRKKL